MSNLHTKQKGLTLIGWIFVLAVGLFFLLLALSIMPSYIRYQTIASVMDTMVDEAAFSKASPKKIKGSFERRIDINGVYDFDMTTLTVTRSMKGMMEMTLEYQDLKPMVGNVEALITFKKTVQL